jgi:hypothetical protein
MAHPTCPGSLREVGGGAAIELREAFRSVHRMHQVVGGVNSARAGEREVGSEQITDRDLGHRCRLSLEGVGAPGEAANAPSLAPEPAQQAPADIARRTGEEDGGAHDFTEASLCRRPRAGERPTGQDIHPAAPRAMGRESEMPR